MHYDLRMSRNSKAAACYRDMQQFSTLSIFRAWSDRPVHFRGICDTACCNDSSRSCNAVIVWRAALHKIEHTMQAAYAACVARHVYLRVSMNSTVHATACLRQMSTNTVSLTLNTDSSVTIGDETANHVTTAKNHENYWENWISKLDILEQASEFASQIVKCLGRACMPAHAHKCIRLRFAWWAMLWSSNFIKWRMSEFETSIGESEFRFFF